MFRKGILKDRKTDRLCHKLVNLVAKLSYFILNYLILSSLILFYLILSSLILHHPLLSYLILPSLILSNLILPYLLFTDFCQLSVSVGRRGRVGLYNLGNSCYMSSSLQCLSHVFPLTAYFLSERYVPHINQTSQDSTGGKLVRQSKTDQ